MGEAVREALTKLIKLGQWCAGAGAKTASTLVAFGKFTAELGKIWGVKATSPAPTALAAVPDVVETVTEAAPAVQE